MIFKGLINPIQKKRENVSGFTFTLNTDGVSVYRNNSIDTWPTLLVINELPQKIRFRPQNIIIACLWLG